MSRRTLIPSSCSTDRMAPRNDLVTSPDITLRPPRCPELSPAENLWQVMQDT